MGPVCLGNISKDWSVDNMKKTAVTGYVYDFSVDYDSTAVDDIKDIHKYLMKVNPVKMFLTGLTLLSSLTNATH